MSVDHGKGAETSRELYLDLLKRTVLATVYEESQWYVMGSRPDSGSALMKLIKAALLKVVHSAGFILVKPDPLTPEALARRDVGSGDGFLPHTMIGRKRLDNIQMCMESVLADGIEGDIIETGAWRGGATIFMRGVLQAHNVTDRTIFVADSFEGFPDIKKGDAAYQGDADVDVNSYNKGGPLDLWLSVPVERVKANFERYGLLDDQVHFLVGWFENTLPSAPIDKLSILRLDGDLYKSTMDALEALYHKVSVGGYIIVDDYFTWPHCKAAIDDFRAREGITTEMIRIDNDSLYWRRES